MEDSPTAGSSSSSREYPLLVRATDGNSDKKAKVKLSTIVRAPTRHYLTTSSL